MGEIDFEGYELVSSWAGLLGQWEFEDATATFNGPQDPKVPFGLAVSNLEVRTGWIEADVTLPNPKSAGRIVFGHDASSSSYYSAGVGGDLFAYYLDMFVSGAGWRPIIGQGTSQNLQADTPYYVELYVMR